MRKTKIICTLGPSTDKEGVLRELIANGMNVARFNFSHGSHDEQLGRLEKLQALREELGKPEAFCVFNNHNGCVRNAYAHFNYCCRN